MRKLVIALLALGVFAASSAFAASDVRISQVFGGNSATNYYNQDYIELFNSSGVDVDISGWAVQYSSSAATAGWGSSGATYATFFVFPAGAKIKACSYLLLGCAETTGATNTIPVAFDYEVPGVGYLNLSATTGKVGLFSSPYTATGVCPDAVAVPTLLDKVAFGTAGCPEGAASAPAPSGTLAIFRANGGMQDTDQNGADFTTGTPAPRNSLTAINPLCSPVPAVPTTWGKVKTIYR